VKWEYLTTTLNGNVPELQDALNAAGADAWELVTCEYHKGQRPCWVLVFKRPGQVPG
jgi:hypothetical protein